MQFGIFIMSNKHSTRIEHENFVRYADRRLLATELYIAHSRASTMDGSRAVARACLAAFSRFALLTTRS